MSKYHCKHLEAREISTDSSSWMQSIQGRGAGTTTQGGDATRGLKNMCIKVGFSDDSKGTFVCFFCCDVSWILGKTPGIYFLFSQVLVFCICNSGGCGVFSFAFFIFSFGRPELRIIYIYYISNDISYLFIMSIHIKQPESNPFTP